jgi:hypothetical protein
MKGFEEMIVREFFIALREGQGIARLVTPPLPRNPTYYDTKL